MNTWNDFETARRDRLAFLQRREAKIRAFAESFRTHLVETLGCPADRIEVTVRNRDLKCAEQREISVLFYYTSAREGFTNERFVLIAKDDESLEARLPKDGSAWLDPQRADAAEIARTLFAHAIDSARWAFESSLLDRRERAVDIGASYSV